LVHPVQQAIRPATCACGWVADGTTDRYNTCAHTNGRLVRHDMVRDELTAILKQTGCMVETEKLTMARFGVPALAPSNPSQERQQDEQDSWRNHNLQPDSMATGGVYGDRKAFFDVTIRNVPRERWPEAQSQKDCLEFLKKHETDKRVKYKRRLLQQGYVFVPVLLTQYGAIGPATRKVLKDWADFLHSAAKDGGADTRRL
jgi:hypothetical protein